MRLAWADLPEQVRGWVGEQLGGPVVEAVSQPGGFSPGTADRVRTADGRRAFVKAVSPAQNEDTPDLHRREIEVLRTLEGVDAVPQLLAAYDDGTWVALVIEDVEGRHPHLPWTDDEIATTLAALGELGAVGAPPSWPLLSEEIAAEMSCWAAVAADPPADLDPWVADRLEELHTRAVTALPRLAGDVVAHTDLRADNILVQPDGRVRLVDWPWASRGAPWADAVPLLLNIAWSGADPLPHLPAVRALGATDDDILGILAGYTGFCTDAARRPPAPGLPTLRQFQREQAVAGTALLRRLWPASG